ncbi:MAG: hypothetical protein ACE5GE_03595, partial [Phycisphaerae bacterium]
MRGSICLMGLAGALWTVPCRAQDEDPDSTNTTTLEKSTSFSLRGGPSYLLSSENVFGTPEIPWPGFLTGMRSTTDMGQRFADPVGNSLYFESPFIETHLRFLYLWHDFPPDSELAGGELTAWAGQVRIALTDRLALIAPKDGWTDIQTGIIGENQGWNDFAVGFKYAFIVDPANDFVLTGGLRWEWHNGDREILQGGDAGHNELTPFVVVGKGFDNWHFIGDVGWRAPMDHNDGNHIIYWDLHVDCEVAPDVLPGFFPLFEIHALHYLTNGNSFPLSVGGLDYT